jgi:hypothetical protein
LDDLVHAGVIDDVELVVAADFSVEVELAEEAA